MTTYPAANTHDSDTPLTILGVPGRLQARTVAPKTKLGCWERQTWVSERRTGTDEHGQMTLVQVNISFDDDCHNGHNTFAITADGWFDRYKSKDIDFGGCCHDKIAKHFPELAPLIKWHLTSTDGPMHYIANTCYHASDRDHNGYRKGEPCSWTHGIRFGSSPVTVKLDATFAAWLKAALEFRETTPKTNPNRPKLEIVEVPHKGSDGYQFKPKYTLDDFGDRTWHKCPFDTLQEAEEFTAALLGSYVFVKIPARYSEGKERDLDAARRTAVWPDATDEQLCLPREQLQALLEARLPALLAEFRADMRAIGFYWSPEEWAEAHTQHE